MKGIDNKTEKKKKIEKDERAIIKAVLRKADGRLATPKAANHDGHIKPTKQSHTPAAGTREYLRQLFSRKDVGRYLWALCVADPWRSLPVPIPISITPGASAATPRMFKVTLRGTASANPQGFLYIGANADGWVQNLDPGVTNAIPIPNLQAMYLGYSPTLGAGFGRGQPVAATQANWSGDTAFVGVGALSAPAVGTTTVSATIAPGSFVGAAFPKSFINQQNPSISGQGERFTQVSLGLRARPLAAPLSAAGRMTMFQQTLGDNQFATFPTTIPGSGAGSSTFAAMSAITEDQLNRHEVAVANWPTEKWLAAAAIPNTTVCFGQWQSWNTQGSLRAGYPMLSVIGEGLNSEMRVEYEAEYVYAYYGVLSFEQNAGNVLRNVHGTADEAASLVSTAPKHMKPVVVSESHPALARQANYMMAQEAVDTGKSTASKVGDYLSTGVKMAEAVTGSSIGDIVGDILLAGFGLLA